MSREPEIVVIFDEMAAFWTYGREAWHATIGDYDLGATVGTGKTPLDAIVDLLDQVDEMVEEPFDRDDYGSGSDGW